MDKTLVALALAVFFSPIQADEPKAIAEPSAKHLQWWVLPSKGLAFPMPGRPAPDVVRSADEAGDALTSQPPEMDGGPRRPPSASLPSGIDWDRFMVVVLAGEGADGAARDVVSVSSDGREILIRAMKEADAGARTRRGEAIALLVTRMDVPVRVEWTDGKIDPMRKERDCAGDGAVHHDVRKPGGVCPRCGGARTAMPKGRLCPACAAELQQCPYCGKRIPGAAPLKN